MGEPRCEGVAGGGFSAPPLWLAIEMIFAQSNPLRLCRRESKIVEPVLEVTAVKAE